MKYIDSTFQILRTRKFKKLSEVINLSCEELSFYHVGQCIRVNMI